MSHSKPSKRGRSQYVEVWNPRAKRFIISCAICGHTGFNPSILDSGFGNTLEKQAIRGSLQRTLDPLALDEFGRCSVCADQAKKAK
jgi:hypothetical protein